MGNLKKDHFVIVLLGILFYLPFLGGVHLFDWDEIIKDIVKRPYITIGMLAFTLLLPLALTSTKKMMKRLGKRWKSLHKLIYLIGILGVLHFILLVKADLEEPIIYAFILFILLLVRVNPSLLHKFSFKPI